MVRFSTLMCHHGNKKYDINNVDLCSNARAQPWRFARFRAICRILKTWKHPWSSITFSKVAEVTLLHGCFLRFLNCTKGTKSRNASQLMISVINQAKTSQIQNNFVQNKIELV